jgi:hypothetical protein
MKTLNALSLAALLLISSSAMSRADDHDDTAQTHAANSNQQTSVRHIKLKIRPMTPPSLTVTIHQ